MTTAQRYPTAERETELREERLWPVAGVDEAGRGALAGPVVAGAVVADWCLHFPWHDEVRDSKQLSASKREQLFDIICLETSGVGVGIVPNTDVDAIGIAAATRKAMCLALDNLAVRPNYVLIDWMTLPQLRIRQEGIVKGDSRCLSIACASIIAKVTRDRIMNEMDTLHPGYNFSQHKGYGTVSHLALLRDNGACPVHRFSFRPVRLVEAGLL
ncbi:MAG: ribonuclease HII [Dehalococcoidia bacterium]|nr:ribonuclease HII [Dehalococcoidia bacterium]